MANRAAQFRAIYAGLPVHSRGRRDITFDLGGNKRMAVCSIDPLHIRNSQTEIDATWVPDIGAWQHKLAACDFDVRARSVLNAGDIVQWTHIASGQYVTLQPLALNWVDNLTDSRQQIAQPQAVTAVANDATLTWTNGYGTGRHFRYTAHPKRLIKELIIDSLANLPAPTVSNPYLEIEFILKRSSGLTLYVDGTPWDWTTKVTTANRLEWRVTATGETAHYFEAPGATDSAGNYTPGVFTLRRQGANRYCTVRIPRAWLDTAVFPVYLDPTFTDGTGGDVATSKDAWIESGGALKNNGTNTTLQVSQNACTLIEFDLSSVEGTMEAGDTATLYLYNDGTAAKTINLHSIAVGNAAWIEGTTNNATAGAGEPCWNALAADGAGGVTTAWAGSAGLATADTDYVSTAIGSFSLTGAEAADTEFAVALTPAVVETWFGASNSNYGIVTKQPGIGNQRGFRSSDYATDTSKRPKLVVVYTEAAGGNTGTATVRAQPALIRAAATNTPPARTGTATSAAQTFDIAASGKQTFRGTVSAAGRPPAISAAGSIKASGTGSVVAHPADIAATGTTTPPARTGTGIVTAQPAVARATGTAGAVTITGTGSVTAQPADVAAIGATGAPAIAGTATVTVQSADMAATGSQSFRGTAAETVQAADVVAAGTVGPAPISGTASVTAPPATVSAQAVEEFVAAGQVAVAAALLSAVGNVRIDITGTGSVRAAYATIAATGTVATLGAMGRCAVSVSALGAALLTAAAIGQATVSAAAIGGAAITVEVG